MADGGRFLVRIERVLERPVPLLKRIGVLLASRAQRRFGEQMSPDGKEWPERMVPNIPGILDDLQRGSSVKPRRFESRPVLMDYGRLRQSIHWELRSEQEVEVGTNIPYAKDHQFGALRTILITPQMQSGLTSWFQTAVGRPWKPYLMWLLNVDSIEFRLPKREFIGINDEDAEDIRQIILDGLVPPGPTPGVTVT